MQNSYRRAGLSFGGGTSCAFVSLEGGEAPPLGSCGCCCCVVVCFGGVVLPPVPGGVEAPPLPVDVDVPVVPVAPSELDVPPVDGTVSSGVITLSLFEPPPPEPAITTPTITPVAAAASAIIRKVRKR